MKRSRQAGRVTVQRSGARLTPTSAPGELFRPRMQGAATGSARPSCIWKAGLRRPHESCSHSQASPALCYPDRAPGHGKSHGPGFLCPCLI